MKLMTAAVSSALAVWFTPGALATINQEKVKVTQDVTFNRQKAQQDLLFDNTGRYFGGHDPYTIDNLRVESANFGTLSADDQSLSAGFSASLNMRFDAISQISGEMVQDGFSLTFDLSGSIDGSGHNVLLGGVGQVSPSNLSVGGVALFDGLDVPLGSMEFDFEQALWGLPPGTPVDSLSPNTLDGPGPYMSYSINPAFGGGNLDASTVETWKWQTIPGPGAVGLLALAGGGSAVRRRRVG